MTNRDYSNRLWNTVLAVIVLAVIVSLMYVGIVILLDYLTDYAVLNKFHDSMDLVNEFLEQGLKELS